MGETTIETLAVQFKVLEESAQQMVQKIHETHEQIVGKTKDTNQKLLTEKEKLIKAEQMLEESQLNDMERNLKRKLEMRKEEQEKIMKMAQEVHGPEAAKIIQQTKSKMEDLDEQIGKIGKGWSKWSEGLSTVNESLKEAGINVGRLATAGALIEGIFAAGKFEQNVEMVQTQMAGMTGRGGDVGLIGGFLGRMTEPALFGQGPGMDPQEAMRAAIGVSRIPGATSDAVFRQGGMAETALLGGRASGLGTERTTEIMDTMVRKLGISADHVSVAFASLVDQAHKLNSFNGAYIERTLQLSTTLKNYGVDIEQSARIVRDFSDDLDKGKMSLQDLAKVMTMGGSMSEGQRAFAGSAILSHTAGLEQMFEGQSAFGMQAVTERILRGNDLVGGNASAATLRRRQDEAYKAIFQYAQNQGNARGGTPEEKQAYTEKFLQAFTGMNFNNLDPNERAKLMHDFSTGQALGEGDRDIIKKAKTDPQLEALNKMGEEIAQLSKDPLAKIIQELEHILEVLGAGFRLVVNAITNPVAFATGNFTAEQSADIASINSSGIGRAANKASGPLGNYLSSGKNMFGFDEQSNSVFNRAVSQFKMGHEQIAEAMLAGQMSHGGASQKSLEQLIQAVGGQVKHSIDGNVQVTLVDRDQNQIGTFILDMRKMHKESIHQKKLPAGVAH